MRKNNPYITLKEILDEALEQTSEGKGSERHEARVYKKIPCFEEQDIVKEAIELGLAAPAYQARKKIKEALRLFDDYGAEAAVPDLLGAISYTAALIIAMRRLDE